MKRLRLWVLLAVAALVVLSLLSDEAGPEIEPGSTLVIELEGEFFEAQQASLIDRALGQARRPFISLLSTLAMAERDDRIETVVVVIRGLGVGWGKADEIRDSIARLRDADRKTIAYLDLASFAASREYFIASACDEIYVVPGGIVPVVGLAAEYFFMGQMWENLGVEFEVAKAGRYKSAVEAVAGRGMSEATSEMANSLLDSMHDAFVAAIAQGRGLEPAKVAELIDQGPMSPSELEELGLADGSLHLDELLDRDGANVVWPQDYASVDPSDLGFAPKAQAALIYGSGNVVEGHASRAGGGPVFAAQTTRDAILDAAEDPAIDAIILIREHRFFEGNVPHRVDPLVACEVLDVEKGERRYVEPEKLSECILENSGRSGVRSFRKSRRANERVGLPIRRVKPHGHLRYAVERLKCHLVHRFQRNWVDDPTFGELQCYGRSIWYAVWLFPPAGKNVAILLPGDRRGPSPEIRDFFKALPDRFDSILSTLRPQLDEIFRRWLQRPLSESLWDDLELTRLEGVSSSAQPPNGTCSSSYPKTSKPTMTRTASISRLPCHS